MNRIPELANWRTTLLAVCAGMSALGSFGVAIIDGDPATNPDWQSVSTAAALMFVAAQGLFSRDARG